MMYSDNLPRINFCEGQVSSHRKFLRPPHSSYHCCLYGCVNRYPFIFTETHSLSSFWAPNLQSKNTNAQDNDSWKNGMIIETVYNEAADCACVV